MRSIIDLIMNSYTSSLYTKNYTHYTLDILAFCLYYFLLIKKRRYFILLKQPPIWSVCLWCAFSGRFVRACVCFVWVSFSSFVCRSSWSFFVCVACCVRFWSFRVVFRIRVFVSYFEVDSRIRFLEFSKSYFEVEFQIRLFRFVALFDFSNFDSNLSSKFSLSCSIRLLEFRFEFVVEFDFSNFIALFDFSKSIVKFDFSKFDFSIQVPWIWWFEIVVEFRIRLFHRLDLFDFSNVDSNCRRNCRFRVAFFIWVLHRTIQFSSK